MLTAYIEAHVDDCSSETMMGHIIAPSLRKLIINFIINLALITKD